MAEDQDQSQKTEEPTQRRLDEARRKGQVATSREINHWFMILAGTIIVLMFLPGMMRGIGRALMRFVESPHLLPTDLHGLHALMTDLFLDLGAALAPVFAVLVLMALLAGLIQNGLVVSPESLKPKLEKISLVSGAKRLFSLRALTEFAKGVVKLAVVGTVATLVVLPAFDSIGLIPRLPVPRVLDHIQGLAVRVLIGVLVVVTVIAALDFLYQKFEHLKRMRMSRQELRDEFKQTEGDPIVKSRLRQIRMERARRRMMAAVPEADVVVTNPTHYAVALKYDPAAMAAPTCVAKGIDALARRIREVAEDSEVPVVENPPLAQALHASVEIDDEIPPEHYKAVAEVIGYVMRLRRRPMPA